MESYQLNIWNVQLLNNFSNLPLSVFNGKRNGSIRTERIKLRHQDIRFSLQYKKVIKNPADYLSRHDIPREALSKNEKK